ncbi:unnamed protein product, partial [Adineta ricciae]
WQLGQAHYPPPHHKRIFSTKHLFRSSVWLDRRGLGQAHPAPPHHKRISPSKLLFRSSVWWDRKATRSCTSFATTSQTDLPYNTSVQMWSLV